MTAARKFIPPAATTPVVINDHRRVMSAMKAATPIIQAMIVDPGSNADAALRATAISEMVKASHAAAARMISILAPDLEDKGWARSDAFSFCASIIADEWKASKNIQLASSILDEELFNQMQSSVIGSDTNALSWMDKVGSHPTIIDHSDAATRLRMSLMKAGSTMVMEINRFAFWQNAEKRAQFIESMVDELGEFAARHSNQLADQYAMKPEDRISFWQGNLHRAFAFAVEEYRRIAVMANDNVDAVASKTSDENVITKEKASWFKKATSGEIQHDILSKVSSNFTILDGIANRLALSMAGNHATDDTDQPATDSSSIKTSQEVLHA